VAVKLVSSSKSVVVPGSATFTAASGGEKTVVIKTVPTATSFVATVTASVGTNSTSVTLQVGAPSLSALTIHPDSVIGKSALVVTGMVSLNGPAPAGGYKVALVSSNPLAASVPASVLIPAGKTTANFTVRHFKVGQSQTITLTAKAGPVQTSVSLTVTP
jgi:hypothetical protein